MSILTKKVSITRPDNTTAYTANDVVSSDPAAAVEFTDMAITPEGGGVIKDIEISAGIAFTEADLRIWLYNAAPTVLIADNVAKTELAADEAKRIGYIDVTMNTATTGSDIVTGQATLEMAYNCAAGSSTLYAVVQILSAVTPVAEDLISISIRSNLDY